MPTLEISKKDLEQLCGKKFSIDKLSELLEFMKISIEKFEQDRITVKLEDANRADLFSTEGIARELKGIIGKEEGMVNYRIEKSNLFVNVDQKVKKVRPYTVCAIVKDLRLTEEAIEQIIQLQEKICETFGRKRKEAAVGIYDFDKIKWPITYTTFKPDSLAFTPLGFVEKLTLKEILEKHEKGKLYGHLLEKAKEYPIFIDANNEVLSMPPIINSEYSGKVTTETKNVFIEVSGFRLEKLSRILNVIVAAFAERKGKIYSVEIRDKKKFVTPIFATRMKVLQLQEINSLLGLQLSTKQVVSLLRKMRYNAEEKKDNKIFVEIPFYREDVIHNVDIIEDIAIIYNYKNFIPKVPSFFSEGKLLPETKKRKEIVELLIGLGLQEINTFILSNKKEQIENMNLKQEPLVEIQNPISETFTCLRKRLLPSLLKFLSFNTTREMPQKIFEISTVVIPDEKKETKTRDEERIAVAIAHPKANFTEIVQVLDYLMTNMKKHYRLQPSEVPYFIPGRAAEIILNEKSVGIVGEISPSVIDNWGIKVPVCAFELELEAFYP